MNFIYQAYLPDISICDRLIDYHKNNPNKYEGMTGVNSGADPDGNNYVVNKKVKDSLDVLLDIGDEFFDYSKNLQDVVEQYIKRYPMSNNYAAWGIKEGIQIQQYRPFAGYHAWHTERTNGAGIQATRHLVFMTYLNDVTDDGETEFYHQDIKIKPRKGLTVIWPADWTHTHRGIPSPTQEKYIITGWFNFS
jgi:hypothetical protein